MISSFILSLLHFFPKLDLLFSSVYYNFTSGNFIYQENNAIVRFFYLIIPLLTKLFLIFVFIYLIYHVIKTKKLNVFYKSSASYLIVAALIGPGLIVNSVLKNYYGRARPAQIVEFGGTKSFAPPFSYTTECQANCAFPSGHASMAFYFSALAYVLASNRKNFNKIYLF